METLLIFIFVCSAMYSVYTLYVYANGITETLTELHNELETVKNQLETKLNQEKEGNE